MLDLFKNKIVIIFVITMLGAFLLGALKERELMKSVNQEPEFVSVNIR